MNLTPDPQAVTDQQAYSPGTRWCAVVSYPDRSGIQGIYGPYSDKVRANHHAKALQEAGIYPDQPWEILPLRRIELGQP